MARLILERVEKVYPGDVRALAPCSLEVADGELLVLVGPSGCGKSTVLRLIAGLEAPTGGTLHLDGRDVTALDPRERNVAMVFQDYALYPHMTARKNLEFPLRMRKITARDRDARVARVAAVLGLASLLDRLPKQLSGGQRQRVAMGRALVRDPAVFLMDEPLSNLDATLRTQVRAEIKTLQRRTGTTTVYVTHDQVEAMTLGDRVAVLRHGVLQQVATPAALYAAPTNVFVAGFIGNPPMNLFPTTLARRADGVAARVGTQTTSVGPDAGFPCGVPLTAGIRPEGVRLVPAEAGTLGATVAHVELLGHETLVHADVDGVQMIARMDGMVTARPGAAIHLRLDPAALHFFDDAGAALTAQTR